MDESEKAFRQWLIDRETLPIPNTIKQFLLAAWRAAIEWARNDDQKIIDAGNLLKERLLGIMSGDEKVELGISQSLCEHAIQDWDKAIKKIN